MVKSLAQNTRIEKTHFNFSTVLVLFEFAMLLPYGKRLHNYGKIHPFFMGKSTIFMAIFNSKRLNYQRVHMLQLDTFDSVRSSLLSCRQIQG